MARPFNFERSVAAQNPIPSDDLLSSERTLARLIALAYAADHPELFGKSHESVNIVGSRPEESEAKQIPPESLTNRDGRRKYARLE